ncbi:helix-turn-helix transcriptional regulator [Sphingorhabdus sp. SMR4y]|uniref:helix-turn-helix transcriptional regulator n=1 Tax=Sphingorhabdus sp. SMR4y TaxID=2584094 RepID=UPI000B5C9851|nr:helix-turn-helix domain-containing protein [Sphingorhabdus sp. SMR4y]
MTEKALTTQEAADHLGVCSSTLVNWRKKQVGPKWYRLGLKRVIYRAADLDSYVEAQANGSFQ